MEPVRSHRNPRVVEAVRLHRARHRRRTGRTLLEGPHLLAEALASGAPVEGVFVLEPPDTTGGLEWILVTESVMRRLAGTDHPRGPVAVMEVPPPAEAVRDRVVLDVSDPGNAGTLIRTAAAFAQDVVMRPGAVDPWSPKVLRAAAGSHFRTRIASAIGNAGTIATVARGGIDPSSIGDELDPARRWAVLVGNEAHGLGVADLDHADVRVTIPMPGGSESLNAAVAGAIVAYELARWRKAAGGSRADH